MAMMGSTSWNGQDPGLHHAADDDFQQFLDMNGMGNLGEGLQFDFTDFQTTGAGHLLSQPPREQLDTPMSGTEAPSILSSQDAALRGQMAVSTAVSHPAVTAALVPPPTASDAINEIDAQIQYLQQQRMQQQRRHIEEQQAAYFARQSRVVPPTPQSLEIQAGSQFFPLADQQSQQQAIFERFQRLKEQQDMSFTPLVSPAVTPLETRFPVETQFTVPGAYFSPLTSPALHAQNESAAMFDQRLATGNSPQNMDLESLPAPGQAAGDASNKKAKKSSTTAKPRKGSVRQSPISKPISRPQRKKTTTTPVISAQVLDQLAETLEPQGQVQQPAASIAAPAPASSAEGATDTENDSVSPETITDMPPPPVPKPRSARPSPHIPPQNNTPALSQAPAPGKPSPATPASLMKLASPKSRSAPSSANQEAVTGGESIETFELPESLNAHFQKPPPSPMGMTPKSQTASPALEGGSAVKTGGFQPLPSPAFAKPVAAASASQSPQLMPGSSATSARKTPQMLPRPNKKRGSISSVHVSPALRPKISPNIKPLLPGGATAEDQASRLLASKSNYQNILEGNTVPGVSYPSELSTNLTSKRTSHKIAEQGRRNRINSALQEIAALLPRPPPAESKGSDGESGDKKGDKGGSGPNSKASTVEMAIEYIKQLQQEVEEANKRAAEAEKRLELKESP